MVFGQKDMSIYGGSPKSSIGAIWEGRFFGVVGEIFL